MINEKALSSSQLILAEKEVRAQELAFLHDKSNWDTDYTQDDRKLLRKQERLSLITRLHPDFRCPVCNCVVTNLRSWVISKEGKKNIHGSRVAVCRRCHFNIINEEELTTSFHMNRTLFIRVRRFEFDYEAFVECRERIGLTPSQFAELVGWSPQYQYKLETGGCKTINEDTMLNLLKVLGDYLITTNDKVEDIGHD